MAHRSHGSKDTGLTAEFFVINGVVPAYSGELVTCPLLIGKPENAPTPNPSPFMGLRKSTLRRESNAWFMIEWAGLVRSCGDVSKSVHTRAGHVRGRAEQAMSLCR